MAASEFRQPAGHRSRRPAAGPARRPAPRPGCRHSAAAAAPASAARASASRCAATSDSAGQPCSAAAVSASTPLQCSTRSQPASIAAAASAPGSPRSAFMQRSSLTSTPSKPMAPRMTCSITSGDRVAGSVRIQRGIEDMRRHRPGARHRPAPRRARNPAPVPRSPTATRGSSRWLSTSARPWPGMCLITGMQPAACSPSATARPSRATSAGSSPKAAVADDVMRAGQPQVEHRGADHVEADIGAIHARAAPHWPAPPRSGQPVEGGGGGEFRPVRRPQPGDPAALLVHQDRRLGAEQVAQLRRSGRGAGRGPRHCGRRGWRRAAARRGTAPPPPPSGAARRRRRWPRAAAVMRLSPRPGRRPRPWSSPPRRATSPAAASASPPARRRNSGVWPSRSSLVMRGWKPASSGTRFAIRSHSARAASSVASAPSWIMARPLATGRRVAAGGGTRRGDRGKRGRRRPAGPRGAALRRKRGGRAWRGSRRRGVRRRRRRLALQQIELRRLGPGIQLGVAAAALGLAPHRDAVPAPAGPGWGRSCHRDSPAGPSAA